MYLGIDVGATKTLFAVFDQTGKVIFEHKVPTNSDYDLFLKNIEQAKSGELAGYQIMAVCCAVPGWIDFKYNILIAGGNIPWQNKHVKNDLEKIFINIPVLVHNDAKLAALSEAILLQKKYKKILYVTISTGVSGGVVTDDVIDPGFNNYEPGQKLYEYKGQKQKWEAFASGKALREQYGKLASEIDDAVIWQEYVKTLIPGFLDMLTEIKPDAVVIGGGVGTHFDKYKGFLLQDLEQTKDPTVIIPPLLKAQRPEEAVIYGCYDYIQQNI